MYIRLLNQFWATHEEYIFPSSTIALYVYLLNECNRRRWQIPFPCSTVLVCDMLRISKQTFSTARKQLEDAGLITFEEGRSRYTPSRYTLHIKKENLMVDLTLNNNKKDKYKDKERENNIPSVSDIENYMSKCLRPEGYALKEGLPQRFRDYYDSNGWMVGGTPMVDWKACARKWVSDSKNLINLSNGTVKSNKENRRVDNRTQVRNFVKEIEQRSLRTTNRR